jgi:hypothetical protein
VICIDARHIKAVANHTFVPADARANEQSVRAKSVLHLNTGHSFRASARPKCANFGSRRSISAPVAEKNGEQFAAELDVLAALVRARVIRARVDGEETA